MTGNEHIFPKTLWEILQNGRFNDIITWGKKRGRGQEAFAIRDPSKFIDEVLPRFFQHGSMATFVRQLNTFGFKRERSKEISYFHPLFLRDRPELLQHISRRTTQYLRVNHALREEGEEAEGEDDDAMQVDDLLQLMVAAGEIDGTVLEANTAPRGAGAGDGPRPDHQVPGVSPSGDYLTFSGAAGNLAFPLGALSGGGLSGGAALMPLCPVPSPPPIPAHFPPDRVQPHRFSPGMLLAPVDAPLQAGISIPFLQQQPLRPHCDPATLIHIQNPPILDARTLAPIPEAALDFLRPAAPQSQLRPASLPVPDPSNEALQGGQGALMAPHPGAEGDDEVSVGTLRRAPPPNLDPAPPPPPPAAAAPAPFSVPPEEATARPLPLAPHPFALQYAQPGAHANITNLAGVPILDPATGRVYVLPIHQALQHFAPRTAATVVGPLRSDAPSVSSQISTKDEDEDGAGPSSTGPSLRHRGTGPQAAASEPPAPRPCPRGPEIWRSFFRGFPDPAEELDFLRENGFTLHPLPCLLLGGLVLARGSVAGASFREVAPWQVQALLLLVSSFVLLDRALFERHYNLWGPVVILGLIIFDATQLPSAIAMYQRLDRRRQLLECLYRLTSAPVTSHFVWLPFRVVFPSLIASPLILALFFSGHLSREHVLHPECLLLVLGTVGTLSVCWAREWRLRKQRMHGR